ncbi:MAG: metal ABC transporter permease [Phycisphaerales bacterium JB052]
MMYFDLGLDLFPLLAAVFAALVCGLLGNFLVLRRLSLMGDAVSHSVLPGLVIAFMLTDSRNPLVMFLGAAIAGIVTVILVEVVKKYGRVEPGAAMGVVFSVLFALGVLLIEQAAVRHIDLDADCVLHGQLETLVWYGAPSSFSELLQWSTVDAIPRQVLTLAIILVLAIGLVTLLYKELRIAAFDSALATAQGFNATIMHYVLMIFVAAATVASFEAVGSILVIAMLVCPAATARLFTDRLHTQILASVIVALICGIGGYFAATIIPALFDRDAVNAAGSMAMVGGLAVTLAIIFSPRHGVLSRVVRRRRLASRVAIDDILAAVYRAAESGQTRVSTASLNLLLTPRRVEAALPSATRRGLLKRDQQDVMLTDDGREAARQIVRKHRLWEHYLVEKAGFAPDHVHDTAEQLEHIPHTPPSGPHKDPHGRDIPGI